MGVWDADLRRGQDERENKTLKDPLGMNVGVEYSGFRYLSGFEGSDRYPTCVQAEGGIRSVFIKKRKTVVESPCFATVLPWQS